MTRNNSILCVLLGKNASGKSNFLEAIVVIFRDLDLRENPQFEYWIKYKCYDNDIEITASPTGSSKYKFTVDGNNLSQKEFYDRKTEFLPRYLFAYYSGISNRLESHFDQHQDRFYRDLLEGIDEPLRPLFYAQLVHSNFVLMAFYSN